MAGLPGVQGTRESSFSIIGYLPEYRMEKSSPEQLGPITDLIYFGIKPPANGHLPTVPVKASIIRRLQEIKRITKCRLLICVGGWGRSTGFPSLAGNKDFRGKFISNMSGYCRANGFDGIDYDWEHPKGAKEHSAYVKLLTETAKAFNKDGLIATVAQANWQDLGKEVYSAVDRVHLMSYDHEFPQATLEKSKADIKKLLGWGCPAGKIALGLPFYGRNRNRDARTYAQLIGSRQQNDDDIIDGFAFNGRLTIRKKVQFAQEQKLNGIMIWELGQDASANNESLLKAIHSKVEKGNPSSE
jgi:chitinase